MVYLISLLLILAFLLLLPISTTSKLPQLERIRLVILLQSDNIILLFGRTKYFYIVLFTINSMILFCSLVFAIGLLKTWELSRGSSSFQSKPLFNVVSGCLMTFGKVLFPLISSLQILSIRCSI